MCVCFNIYSLFTSSKSPIQSLLIPPLFRMSVLLKTTATVYCHSVIYSLVFVKQQRFRCLCPISNCVLSGCGGNTEQVNKILLSFFSHYLYFSFAALPLLSTPVLSSSHLSLFPLSLSALWLSSSRAWEKLTVVSPENLSESGEKGGGGGASNSAHLLHSRHFGFSVFEEDQAAVILSFSYCQQIP